ncbi:hypothetical protein I2486_21300 [Cellulophaga sp. E16_2]|uniref:hypothetical protein n=1 Tax=Cellulophaga sp. E16_2 TaxID=2789297 RepID=UPI001A9182B7|nr:hypothetical protein [Cellulophaga sp. E16_2]MBO0593944.1 hypothetical protein [Cellulophaga sp. E16_2]
MKKPLTTIITLLVLISIFWNCKPEKIISETEFEQAVFYKIFPAILDSIYYDRRLVPPPPPPPDFLEKKGYDVKNDYKQAYENWDMSDENEKRKGEWEKKKDSLNRDTNPIYLTVSDSITQFEREDLYELIKHFKNQNIVLDSKNIELDNGYKIDLEQLKTNNGKLRFKYQSEFPEGFEFRRTEYDFYIAASIGFNRILFDKTKTYGVLNGGFVMGNLNGHGFRIFIRKDDNGKWLIDEVVGTWIS